MVYELRYDPEADVLSIILRRSGKLSHAEECGDFVIHLDGEGRPLLIEVLRASEVVRRMADAVTQAHGGPIPLSRRKASPQV